MKERKKEIKIKHQLTVENVHVITRIAWMIQYDHVLHVSIKQVKQAHTKVHVFVNYHLRSLLLLCLQANL
jgi:hypothetical protein